MLLADWMSCTQYGCHQIMQHFSLPIGTSQTLRMFEQVGWRYALGMQGEVVRLSNNHFVGNPTDWIKLFTGNAALSPSLSLSLPLPSSLLYLSLSYHLEQFRLITSSHPPPPPSHSIHFPSLSLSLSLSPSPFFSPPSLPLLSTSWHPLSLSLSL